MNRGLECRAPGDSVPAVGESPDRVPERLLHLLPHPQPLGGSPAGRWARLTLVVTSVVTSVVPGVFHQ